MKHIAKQLATYLCFKSVVRADSQDCSIESFSDFFDPPSTLLPATVIVLLIIYIGGKARLADIVKQKAMSDISEKYAELIQFIKIKELKGHRQKK